MKKTAVVTVVMDGLLFGGRVQGCVGVVVRRVLSISLMMSVIMALAGNVALGEAGVSLVKNGSFENDGPIWDITVDAPQYWCDVNIPTDEFLGWIDSGWSSYGDYSLTLYSGFGTFIVGDMAGVSQLVYLADVNQIIFDVELITIEGQPWPEGKRSAVLLIDREIIWDSNNMAPSGNGEYLGVVVDVNEEYKDANSHILSLAMKANISETEYFYEYLARWDFVKFDTYCSGLGFRAEDFDHDCHVGMDDLRLLVEQWLVEDVNLNCPYDLVEDGIVNFRDFGIFANYWINYRYWENWQPAKCYQIQQLLDSDLDDSGEVNHFDLGALADNWLNEGSCIRADLNEDGIVNFQDFAILANQWLQRSWLYGL